MSSPPVQIGGLISDSALGMSESESRIYPLHPRVLTTASRQAASVVVGRTHSERDIDLVLDLEKVCRWVVGSPSTECFGV